MKITANKKIKKILLYVLLISLIFILFFTFKMIIYSKNSKFIDNITTSVSLNFNNNFLKDNILCNESFDIKTKENYIPFVDKAINMDLKIENKDIKPINLNIDTKYPSIQIDYNEESKPSIAEIAIQSDTGEFYYWDFEIKKNKFLNFLFPSPIIEKKGLNYVRVDLVWKKNENILGVKTYSFNINLT